MELSFLPAAARELTDSARVWEAWGMTISPEQAAMLETYTAMERNLLYNR